jgi:hypothetical protein
MGVDPELRECSSAKLEFWERRALPCTINKCCLNARCDEGLAHCSTGVSISNRRHWRPASSTCCHTMGPAFTLLMILGCLLTRCGKEIQNWVPRRAVRNLWMIRIAIGPDRFTVSIRWWAPGMENSLGTANECVRTRHGLVHRAQRSCCAIVPPRREDCHRTEAWICCCRLCRHGDAPGTWPGGSRYGAGACSNAVLTRLQPLSVSGEA